MSRKNKSVCPDLIDSLRHLDEGFATNADDVAVRLESFSDQINAYGMESVAQIIRDSRVKFQALEEALRTNRIEISVDFSGATLLDVLSGKDPGVFRLTFALRF